MRPVGLRGGGRRVCWAGSEQGSRVRVQLPLAHRGHAELALLALLAAAHASLARGHPVHGGLGAGLGAVYLGIQGGSEGTPTARDLQAQRTLKCEVK